jgi:hypothetical protein
MKNTKHSVVIGKPDSMPSNWNRTIDQILRPKRKRAWSAAGKMNSLAAVNFNEWLKIYES